MTLVKLRPTILAALIGAISFHAVAAPLEQDTQGPQSANGADPCAKNSGQVAGAIVGALLGGFLGNKVGKGNGKTLATAVGALGGLALGNYIGSELDRRKCEVSKIAKRNNLDVVIVDLAAPPALDPDTGDMGRPAANAPRVGMSLSIEDRAPSPAQSDVAGGDTLGNASLSTQFQSGSDVLSARADGYFRDIAREYALPFRADALPQSASQEQATAVQGLRHKRLLILGHTDDTGNSRLNADLSEQRARNVARLFGDAGMPVSQIFYQGSGETQPVADNRTEAGRAKNRRVEIIDLTDEAAFQSYLASRTVNTNFYRVVPRAASAAIGTPEPEAPSTFNAPVNRAPASKLAKAAKPARPASAVRAADTAAAASPTRAVGAVARADGYDFGGKPAGQAAPIAIGKLVTPRSMFNFISTATADDMPVSRNCTEDRPRVSNAVKGLQGNQEYKIGAYLPNLYDTSWTDTVNGNLVALTHVAVLRDGATPARTPTVLLYKAAHGQAGPGAKADFSATAEVNTYQGETALLYRVFVNGPIKCMDIVIPRDRSAQASNSSFYYEAGGAQMVAAFNPKIVK